MRYVSVICITEQGFIHAAYLHLFCMKNVHIKRNVMITANASLKISIFTYVSYMN